jgi:hypothetical protein
MRDPGGGIAAGGILMTQELGGCASASACTHELPDLRMGVAPRWLTSPENVP